MGVFDDIRQKIRNIPEGNVSTYGDIGKMAGTGARTVARCLASRKKGVPELPWHRILGKGGRILLPVPGPGEVQRALLEKEGIRFEKDGSVDLTRYGYTEDPLPEEIADLFT